MRWRPACGTTPWLALLLVGCGGADPASDVLLVTFDTLRADHTTPYGHPRPTTPTLGRLAAEGVLFEVAYAPVGATSPSHATLFTSKQPIEHGVERNGLGLAEGELTLAEYLREHGFRTAACVSSFPVSRRFGFAQGFDHFEEQFPLEGNKIDLERWGGANLERGFDRPAEGTAAAAVVWLEGEAARPEPLFLWLHFFDAHAPWLPSPPLQREFPPQAAGQQAENAAAYEAEIRRADDALGLVIAAFERLRPGRARLTLVTADHGESLGEHGYTGHNRDMYEPELRIPLVLHGPGIPSGVRSARPAHLVDVAPTLSAALGLAAHATWGGEDLLGAGAESRPLFFQRPYFPRGRDKFSESGQAYGLRVGPWKYLEASDEGRRELYDLDADPAEARNLEALEPQRAAALGEQLRALLARQRAQAGTAVQQRDEDLEGLRALGYLDDQ